MTIKTRQSPKIRQFILDQVTDYPRDISAQVIKKFGLSRTSANNYLSRLVGEGWLEAEGNTKARRYRLRKIADIAFNIPLSIGLAEHEIWHFRILPHIKNVPQHIIDICQYGFTEILNNAIDHSASLDALISFEQTSYDITITIIDRGVGIFEKIKNDFNLSDARSALLELSKGKLTSDPSKHAGEGIFFTSRMFDKFRIRSGNLVYLSERSNNDDWLIETREPKKYRYRQGTGVVMTIPLKADWTRKEVFEQFQNKKFAGRKTHIPLALGRYPHEQLVSRSQAKRILSRFDDFSEIILDFKGIESIGQAFADEIFRVFRQHHPEIELFAINTNADIDRMIAYVQMTSPKTPPV